MTQLSVSPSPIPTNPTTIECVVGEDIGRHARIVIDRVQTRSPNDINVRSGVEVMSLKKGKNAENETLRMRWGAKRSPIDDGETPHLLFHMIGSIAWRLSAIPQQ